MIRIGIEDHPYRELERSGWQRAAQGYLSSFKAAQVRPGVKLLDVACGAGLVTGLASSQR